MMMRMKGFLITVALVWMIFVFAMPVYAYLDPGSGSMILQAVLGVFAAVMVVVKIYWSRLLKFFGLRKKDESSN
jgi:hypothetical protein